MLKLPSIRRITTLVGTAALVCAGGLSVSYAQNDTNDDATFRGNVGAVPTAKAESIMTLAHHQPPGSPEDRSGVTRTPIKHVILIIGENRTFDHVFATYQPPKGQTVSNLLSKGIVNLDGTPGPNVKLAQQWQATDTDAYSNSPTRTQPYATLPDINTDGAPTTAPAPSPQAAEAVEPALPAADYGELANGGTGLPKGVVDTRFPPNLPNAPVDLSRSISYDDYASSPVHRFFQMWQQLDCDARASSFRNPSGCRSDLFPWVEVTIGAGSNGAPQPASFTDQSTREGSTSMQFFNVAKGDVPYFTQLAQQYALSDNFHQSVQGGTGANHIMLGYGSLIYYADAKGHRATPPAGQIENPDPQPGTNNYYTQDGYGSETTGGGGSYVNCADEKQPGVGVIRKYLRALPYEAFRDGDCAPNAYYLVNNYNPGYLGTGTPAPLGDTQFTIPPTTQNNLGLLLSKHKVSWKYYGEGWANGTESGEAATFCNICDPFLYSTQIMTNPTLRANNQDITDLYDDIQNDTLPAVSIVKPDGLLDGHPASSKLDLFEGFCQKIIEMVQANPSAWADTAVMITFDEGGGYWDSGYVQAIDFFGDGTRIPLLVVSKYSQGGRVVHTYYDHVSFDKFVESNWDLRETISPRGRDNLPNPVVSRSNPYVPLNQPAIGDLMDMFDFGRHRG
ncbi:MAG TPA: alkaline phosphatase family protein [Steroidobacteraceae bacterium]|nr:alkaline phosphatase family protein [Steroidobacteraceae bacterium]